MVDTRLPHVAYPDMVCYHVGLVPLEALYEQGIRAILVDLDNTLALRGTDDVTPQARSFIARAKSLGFSVAIVSNIVCGKRRERRVRRIAGSLGVPYVCARFPWLKPHRLPYIQALFALDFGVTRANQVIVVGDQLFTDVKGAAKLGLRTILVKPLGKDSFFTWPKRVVQNLVMRIS